MITGINKSKKLTKHISRESKCRLDERKYHSYQWWNNNKCLCECKKRRVCQKDYIWNPSTCICENGKYLASIMDDSAIMCDEVNKETKAIPANLNEKKVIFKTQNFYTLLVF